MHFLTYLVIALGLILLTYLCHTLIQSYLHKLHAKITAERETLKQSAKAEADKIEQAAKDTITRMESKL